LAADHGSTLIDVLFVVSLLAILSALVVPSSLAAIDRIRAGAAVRHLASRMATTRANAVMRSTHVAMRFEEEPSGISFRMFADGNGNGVRTADIATGIDRPLDAPTLLGDHFPGVAIAVAGSAGTDPVRLGSTDLLSFTPFGTATAGSVYVRGRDGSQFAIRILGTTGRTRTQRYIERTRTWVDTL
jgi:type II secretory pathway pseudopilin PulG